MLDTYSIGDVAKKTGVSIKKLRHWEEKDYIPTPERVVCGERAYRRYSESQIQLIAEIKKYLDQGYKLSMAVELSNKNMEV